MLVILIGTMYVCLAIIFFTTRSSFGKLSGRFLVAQNQILNQHAANDYVNNSTIFNLLVAHFQATPFCLTWCLHGLVFTTMSIQSLSLLWIGL